MKATAQKIDQIQRGISMISVDERYRLAGAADNIYGHLKDGMGADSNLVADVIAQIVKDELPVCKPVEEKLQYCQLHVMAQYWENYETRFKPKGAARFVFPVYADDFSYYDSDVIEAAVVRLLSTQNNEMCKYTLISYDVDFNCQMNIIEGFDAMLEEELNHKPLLPL